MRTSKGTRQRSRGAAGVAVGLSLAMLAGACGDGATTNNARPENEKTTTTEAIGDPVHGGDITVGLESETTSLLPGQVEFTNSFRNVAYALYDPLVVTGADGEYHPFLAKSFHGNETATEWTVELRPGITFHDGSTLDANDMKAIFDEFLKPAGSAAAGQLAGVSELRVDGDLVFTYVLSEPNGAFPDLLRGPIGWPFSVDAARAAGFEAGSRPVGTGPFKLETWVPDDRLVVTRNDNYWRDGLPYLDSVTFRPIPDEESRVSSLLTGGVDAIQALRGSTAKAVMAAENDGFKAHVFAGDDAGVTYLNVMSPPFDDVRIRRAYAHAVDQEVLMEALGDKGITEPTTQFYSADSPWYSEKVAKARPTYDLEKAKKLVADYVNDPDRSDGKPVGTPPTVSFMCLADPSLLEVAQASKLMATAAGFDISVENEDQATLVQRIAGSTATEPPYRGDYSASCFRVGGGDPATLFGGQFGPPEATVANHTNFTTPEIQELAAELRVTKDFEERYAIVEKMGVLVNEAAVISYVSATPAMVGVHESVKNVENWTTPEGEKGEGIPFGVARWSEVWVER